MEPESSMCPTMASDVNAFIVGAHAASLAQTAKLRLRAGAKCLLVLPGGTQDHHNVKCMTTLRAEAWGTTRTLSEDKHRFAI